ncbi:glucosyl-3-phosphoglycerate synthase [Conexibacter sp. DBS9H8]|uniref:glucosyl-3-phosphoglycerate synthase n=1 Tax=Conexibacter sp. DBS9H8 TaxID=2937801 RepID=UPI0020102771|nr:glucosyl-3-phosphoglycerate synthase [Conexibacter sp. DBS9H8]
MSLRARAWEQTHTHHHRAFPADRLAAERSESVSVCLPARNEAATIGPIIAALVPLLDAGVIDQLVVVDDSEDGTGAIAAAAGAEVYDQAALVPELGPVLGKGDAMWRALTVLDGEVICFLDADSEDFGDHFARGLLGPLLVDGTGSSGARTEFVKGFYRRPFKVGSLTLPDGGGRVTELTARPLLELFYPELAGIRQPLAGEIAARRSLLESLPFATGYGVDIALLIDAYAEIGLESLAQVDLDVRQNAHQALRDLRPMASAVLAAVHTRLQRDGRYAGTSSEATVERPPLLSHRRAAA